MQTILYIADSSSWHNVLWTEYFCENYNVLLFSDKKPSYKKVFFDKRVKIFEFPPVINFRHRHLNKVTSISYYLKKLKEVCAEHHVDIIHCVAVYYAFLGAQLKKSQDLPLIYTLQGSEVLIRAKQHMLYSYMIKSALKEADIITGDSNAILQAAKDLGNSTAKSFLIQNGVRLSLFYPNSTARHRLKKMFSVRDDEFLLFSPRAITALYNIDIIIKALAILVGIGIRFKAVFTFGFGEENLRSLKSMALELGVDRNIIWHGYVDYKEMPLFYQGSDLVISIPSSDSSPKSVYESMACKTPVLVSNLPWVQENFQIGKSIHVLDHLSPRCLANQIQLLLRGLPNREHEAFIEEAYRIVTEKFSYEKNMGKMEEIMLTKVGNKAEVSWAPPT